MENSTMPGLLGTTANVPYRWVRVTLKANNNSAPYYVTSTTSPTNNIPICWDTSTGAGHQIPNPAPAGTKCEDVVTAGGSSMRSVYVLTSLAVVPNSGSRRMVQMEVANDAPFITNAALDTDDFVNVKGASVTVNGYDNCKCACDTGKGSHPPVCTNRVSGAPCTGDTYSIYSSKEITTNPDPSPGLVAGTSPPYAENQTFPYDVPALIARYSTQQGAVNITGSPYNQTCTPQTPPAYPDCGKITSDKTLGTLPTPFPPTDPTNPVGLVNQTTYVPGNLDITAKVNGAGVLIIDGDFTVHGGLNFYGLIIVRGIITFAGSGGGQDVNVIGSIVAGEGSVADKLSGGVNIQFDRCALMNNTNPAPPSMLATHELSY
jgi:hypothetical protein